MTRFILFTFIVVFASACGRFNAHSNATAAAASDANVPAPPNQTKPALVSVAVGVGGRILSGTDGFANVLTDTEKFSPDVQAGIVYGTSSGAVSCPAGSGLSVTAIYGTHWCCYSPTECIGNGWETDFLYRSVAYGNGRFVAVGGFYTGFSAVSTDGVHWSGRNLINKAAGTLTGPISATNWIGGIAYGNGVFIAVGYDRVPLVSTDGLNWTVTAPALNGRPLRSIFFLGDHFYASGDNGTWGLTVDGSSWTNMGVSLGLTDVYRKGDMMYGVVYTGGFYKASAVDGGANWTLVNSSASFGSFVLDPLTQVFNIFTGNKVWSALDPDGTFTETPTPTPGRWIHHSGEYFIGGYTDPMRSVDGKTWTTFPSASGFKQPFLGMASGMVNLPSD